VRHHSTSVAPNQFLQLPDALKMTMH
jgi:hypothetical protein